MPSIIVGGIGGILAYQDYTGHWESWSYLWTLIPGFVGLGIGVTAGGIVIDQLIASGSTEPYSQTLLGFTVLSLLCIPCFYMAGKRFRQDRDRLFATAE